MKVIDPGHKYEVDVYDGKPGATQELTFMKREGPGYPMNVGHYPGTNCQEHLRVFIDRMHYLQMQEPCEHNLAIIEYARRMLWLFEDRAASRHGIDQFDYRTDDIEQYESCKTCGHIICKGHNESGTGKKQRK